MYNYLVDERGSILWPYVVITLADHGAWIVTLPVNVACLVCWRHLSKCIHIILLHSTEQATNYLVVLVCDVCLCESCSQIKQTLQFIQIIIHISIHKYMYYTYVTFFKHKTLALLHQNRNQKSKPTEASRSTR